MPTVTPSGTADQYFRTGPPGSCRCWRRLILAVVAAISATFASCCECSYRSPPVRRVRLSIDGGRERARRHRRRAARVQGARMPCSWIADPHGVMAGNLPAAGYGRVRFLCDESHENRQRAKKENPAFRRDSRSEEIELHDLGDWRFCRFSGLLSLKLLQTAVPDSIA